MKKELPKDIIVFSEETHKRWKRELNQYGLLYIYAMSGFGKTVQAIEFANHEYKEWGRIPVSEKMFDEINTFVKENQNNKTKSLLIIDDLQWLLAADKCERFLEILLDIIKNHKMIHCMVLSRARLPEYLMVLRLTKQIAVEDSHALTLTTEMMAAMFTNSGLIQVRTELFKSAANIKDNYAFDLCVKKSFGYAIAVNAYIERLKEGENNYIDAYKLAIKDVFTFFEIHIYNAWDLQHREAVRRLAVCDYFDKELARIILGSDADEILKDMYQIGSFICEEAGGIMRINTFFLGFLREKLDELPEKDIATLCVRVGAHFEKKRNYIEALDCYYRAGLYEEVINIICYLSENSDGCEFARTCYKYMEELPNEYEERFPKVLAAKTMIYSYHMELEKSDYYLDKLREKARNEKKGRIGKAAMTNYVRALIALPHGSAAKTLRNLKFFPGFVKENGIKINNIMPTGNMPSMINGGLDLINWGKKYKIIYPVMKSGAERVIGKEAVGIADISVGEHLYELGEYTKAIAYLTRGLSEANLKGSIRAQYAAIGIMAREFQADNQWDTANEILNNILEKAKEMSFAELVPNIQASILEGYLLKGDKKDIEMCLAASPIDEHVEFFITDRYRLFVKCKVYIMQGRNIEALHIIGILERYAKIFDRTYWKMQMLIFRAIIHERMGEEWEEILVEAIKMCEEYKYVRIFADQGSALLPLWKKIMEDEEAKTGLNGKYLSLVYKEMKNMSGYYPNYLKVIKAASEMTKKEIEVLRLMSDGMNNQQIAKALSISVATVKFHVSNVIKKLGVDNRTGAVATAKNDGLL